MTNGSLVYTPPITKALSFNNDYYLSVLSSYLDFGTSDFSINACIKFGSTTSATTVIACTSVTNTAAGWALYYNKAAQSIVFNISDGTNSRQVTATSTVPDGSYYWVAVDVDKTNKKIKFYISGNPSGDSSLGAVGSISNSNVLNIAGHSSGYKLAGEIEFIRFASKSFSYLWYKEEYYRVAYCYPRWTNGDFYLFDFETSLKSTGVPRITLTQQGTGTLTYVVGYPYVVSPFTPSFVHNYAYGHSEGYAPIADFTRSGYDGSIRYVKGSNKKIYTLSFDIVNPEFRAIVEAAYLSNNLITVYLDGTTRGISGFVLEPPVFRHLDYQQKDNILFSSSFVVHEA